MLSSGKDGLPRHPQRKEAKSATAPPGCLDLRMSSPQLAMVTALGGRTGQRAQGREQRGEHSDGQRAAYDLGRSLSSVGSFSIRLTTSCPLTTLPNTTCLLPNRRENSQLHRHGPAVQSALCRRLQLTRPGAGWPLSCCEGGEGGELAAITAAQSPACQAHAQHTHMKNCEPLVLGPRLAMDRV